MRDRVAGAANVAHSIVGGTTAECHVIDEGVVAAQPTTEGKDVFVDIGYFRE